MLENSIRPSEAGTHEVHEKLALVRSLERMPAKIHKVNFDSLLDVLRNIFEEVLLRLRLVKGSVSQVTPITPIASCWVFS